MKTEIALSSLNPSPEKGTYKKVVNIDIDLLLVGGMFESEIEQSIFRSAVNNNTAIDINNESLFRVFPRFNFTTSATSLRIQNEKNGSGFYLSGSSLSGRQIVVDGHSGRIYSGDSDISNLLNEGGFLYLDENSVNTIYIVDMATGNIQNLSISWVRLFA